MRPLYQLLLVKSALHIFRPLLLNPIDFADLFRRHAATQQVAAQQVAGNA